MLLEVIDDQAAGFPELGTVNARLMTCSSYGSNTLVSCIGHDDAAEATELLVRSRSSGFAVCFLGFRRGHTALRVQWERELSKTAVPGVLALGDFLGLQAFGPLNQSELDFLSLVQAAIAITLNRSEMNKDVIWPVGHCDEAEALGIVEPLNGSRLAV
jgi:hypothetical protein